MSPTTGLAKAIASSRTKGRNYNTAKSLTDNSLPYWVKLIGQNLSRLCCLVHQYKAFSEETIKNVVFIYVESANAAQIMFAKA